MPWYDTDHGGIVAVTSSHLLSCRYLPTKPRGQTHDAEWPEGCINGVSVHAPPWLVDALQDSSIPMPPTSSSATSISTAALVNIIDSLSLGAAPSSAHQVQLRGVHQLATAGTGQQTGPANSSLACCTSCHDSAVGGGAAAAAATSSTTANSSSRGSGSGDSTPAACGRCDSSSGCGGDGSNGSVGGGGGVDADQPLWSIRNGFNR
jgi:hypothetical protein